MIFLALFALWLVIWLVSAVLASQTARTNGYDSGLFFRYGLLAGPWAYLAAQNASSYDVGVEDELGDPSAQHFEPGTEFETSDVDGGDGLGQRHHSLNELDPAEGFDESVQDFDPTETPSFEPTEPVYDYAENPSAESPLDTPDPDPEHVAEMDNVLAAEAAAIEAMLRGEDPDSFDQFGDRPVTPDASLESDWTTRSGEVTRFSFSDLDEKKPRGRKKFQELEAEIEKVVEEPAKVKRGLFGRKKRDKPVEPVKESTEQEGHKAKSAKSAKIPIEPAEGAVIPITDATAPDEPTAGTCASCRNDSYVDWHGLCSRCGEVWQPTTAKHK